jgi:hypothetical protein
MLYFNKSSSKRKGVTFSETKDLKASSFAFATDGILH